MDYLWTPWRYSYVAMADKAPRQGVPERLSGWPGDKHCVFCNLIASVDYAREHGMDADEADEAGFIVLRAEKCFICLNSFPYNSGHVMVVPYEHVGDLTSLEETAAQEMMALARSGDQVLREVYQPDGINLGMNLGKAAGAGVADHLHLHLLPRWSGDTNFMTVVGETRVLPEALSVTWRRLRDGFAANK